MTAKYKQSIKDQKVSISDSVQFLPKKSHTISASFTLAFLILTFACIGVLATVKAYRVSGARDCRLCHVQISANTLNTYKKYRTYWQQPRDYSLLAELVRP